MSSPPLAVQKVAPDTHQGTSSSRDVHLICRAAEQETHGSKMAFLDGPPPTRLCQPMADYMLARGGELKTNQRVSKVLLNTDQTVRFTWT